MNLVYLTKKQSRTCKCGHRRAVHEHNRSGTDCSMCKCTIHPDLQIGPYETTSCLMYPEHCHGICWKFKDSRSLTTRVVNFFQRR